MEYLVLGTLLILLKITIVSMATIHFTRDQLDTFIPLKACDATTNHVHNSMSCKCNSNTKTFIGYNCTHNIDACRIKQHKKRLSDEISSNDKVYVYNYVKGAPSWDEALGNAIKKVLVQGTRNHDQLVSFCGYYYYQSFALLLLVNTVVVVVVVVVVDVVVVDVAARNAQLRSWI